MTLTKMIKTLKALSEQYGADYEVIHSIDYWGDQNVRDVITIGHFIGWFETKADNQYFKYYSVTDRFRALQKYIETHQKPIEVKTFYQDSYDKYMSEWKEQHPGEDYEQFCKNQREKRRRDWLSVVGGMYVRYLGSLPQLYY